MLYHAAMEIYHKCYNPWFCLVFVLQSGGWRLYITTRNVGFPESLLIQLCITQWFLIIGELIIWHKRRVKGSWNVNFSGGACYLLTFSCPCIRTETLRLDGEWHQLTLIVMDSNCPGQVLFFNSHRPSIPWVSTMYIGSILFYFFTSL